VVAALAGAAERLAAVVMARPAVVAAAGGGVRALRCTTVLHRGPELRAFAATAPAWRAARPPRAWPRARRRPRLRDLGDCAHEQQRFWTARD
jgi:hypothetical protein